MPLKLCRTHIDKVYYVNFYMVFLASRAFFPIAYMVKIKENQVEEMKMSRKTISMILVIAGILLVGVSLLADILGIGKESGFGWKQSTGLIIGLLIVLINSWMLKSKE